MMARVDEGADINIYGGLDLKSKTTTDQKVSYVTIPILQTYKHITVGLFCT
jgi:hypothetical protein